MELPKSIRFSSVVADPEAYIKEVFQLHPDAIHNEHSGSIEIKNEILDSAFRYQLLEEGLFLFTFSSFSPVDAEYEFIPNPNSPYLTLVFYFTETRSKNPLYLKLDEAFHSSDHISLFFNGKMYAEFFIKAKQRASGLRLDIHKDWLTKNFGNAALKNNLKLNAILGGKNTAYISTKSELYHDTVVEVCSQIANENFTKTVNLKALSYSLIRLFFDEEFCDNIEIASIKMNSGELKSALNYMEKHVNEEFVGSDFLADLCCISESSFNKKFKTIFRVSPAHYFRNLKMKEALTLLQLGYNVKDVAYKLDYKDVSAFGRSFKQIYGKSPASYVKS